MIVGNDLSREFDRLDNFVDGLLSDCGTSSGDEVFGRVHFLRFVLKEWNCSLHRASESRPLRTKRTRLRPRRRAAEPQQARDSTHKQKIFACWRELAAEQPEARARAG